MWGAETKKAGAIPICVSSIIFCLFICFPLQAQETIWLSNDNVPAFGKVEDDARIVSFKSLPHVEESIGTELIEGHEVSPTHFPTIFRKTTGDPCTSLLVGPEVMLTAAHCVTPNTEYRFELNRQLWVRGKCRHAASDDLALCILQRRVRGIVYERVRLSFVPADNAKVMLTGRGCFLNEAGREQFDKKLRVGYSTTVKAATLSQDILAKGNHNTIYTNSKVTGTGVVLCDGDSGGPLYIMRGTSYYDARDLVGINKASHIGEQVSLFTSTGTSDAKKFFDDWLDRHPEAKICGINFGEGQTLTKCR